MFVYLRQRIHCRSSHCGNPPVRLHSAVCAADSVCDTLRTPGRPSEQYAWPDSVGGEGKRKKEMQLFSEHKLYHFCVAFWFKELINGRCFRPNSNILLIIVIMSFLSLNFLLVALFSFVILHLSIPNKTQR